MSRTKYHVSNDDRDILYATDSIRRFAGSQIFMQNLAELSLGCVYGTHLHFQW